MTAVFSGISLFMQVLSLVLVIAPIMTVPRHPRAIFLQTVAMVLTFRNPQHATSHHLKLSIVTQTDPHMAI